MSTEALSAPRATGASDGDREDVEALADVLRRHNDVPDGNNRYTSDLQDALFNVWAEADDNVGDYDIGELLAEAAIKSVTATILDSPAMRALLAEARAKALREAADATERFAEEVYGEHFFRRPTKQDYAEINALLKRERGHQLDGVGADCYHHALMVRAEMLREMAADITSDRTQP